MVKKKAPKNAFYFFFTELKAKQKTPCSNEKAVELASPLWNQMSPEERKPYEEKAKITKKNLAKETCAGESVYSVLAEEKEKIQKKSKSRSDIETMLKLAYSDGTLAETNFYLIHINNFLYHDISRKYYPAEIALGKFNLQNGIIKNEVYHSVIYPGKFPIGYTLTARQKSEETHKLPIDFGSKNNVLEVVNNLLDFNKDHAVLFVTESELDTIEKILDNMFEECQLPNPFNIYPLDYLLFILKNIVHGAENNVWPILTLGTVALEKDLYGMCEDIACDYHQTLERQLFCSLSKVIRWAYTVCDNCSHHLGIKLIPGQHVPPNADIKTITGRLAESKLSSKSSQISSNSCLSGKTPIPTTVAAPKPNSLNYDINSDIASYHGFESSDGREQDEEEQWKQPKRAIRLKRNHQMQGNDDAFSACSGSQSQTQSQSQNEPLNLSDLSYRSTYLPGRHPESISMVGFRGRGRGKHIKRNE
ncbi:protein maelstrom homolog [Onthophagus taurus]|uniref:protein maelstrom homolog n=1 Tax=Onthophagus taurus TaxID=166361 RepID=UPI000C20C185|nr:protein maelstrom homolog [Onthophagus taurus]XP_022912784.1 protein maelstrom homolog [Onthophagus taurus]